MASIRRIRLPWSTAYSNLATGDGVFIPMTAWSAGVDLGKVRACFEVNREVGANLVTRLGYHTANGESSPDAVVALDSECQTTWGVNYGRRIDDIPSPAELP